ncbi:MAG: TolC family protein, partial [Croceitalea sp.]|nr:TolC family protein [Croceitalea sp.]
MKNIWIPFLSVLIGLQTYSQATKTIALEEVLNKVQESNTSIKISGFEAKAAQADFAMSNAVYLPNISVSHTAMATTNPLMAFGSKLNQELLTQADFNPQLLNDPNQIENFATRISVEQPLINMDGILQRKAAKSTMEARALQLERSKDYLNFEAEKAYAQLQLAYKSVEVLQKTLEAAQANEDLTKNRFEQGLIQKADLLQAQVRTSAVTNQLASANSNLKNASDYLAYLMNTDKTMMFEPATELLPKSQTLNHESASVDNRSDIKAMAMVSDAYQANYKADQLTFLPRLNAFGSYELFDDRIFSVDAKGYTFGA